MVLSRFSRGLARWLIHYSSPLQSKIHPTVHVSLLNKCHEVPAQIAYLPTIDIADPYCSSPESILQRRMVKKGDKAVAQVLVKWMSFSADLATWEFASSLATRFPQFDPCGQGSFAGGSIDTHLSK